LIGRAPGVDRAQDERVQTRLALFKVERDPAVVDLAAQGFDKELQHQREQRKNNHQPQQPDRLRGKMPEV
jgi:hypothetical protein